MTNDSINTYSNVNITNRSKNINALFDENENNTQNYKIANYTMKKQKKQIPALQYLNNIRQIIQTMPFNKYKNTIIPRQKPNTINNIKLGNNGRQYVSKWVPVTKYNKNNKIKKSSNGKTYKATWVLDGMTNAATKQYLLQRQSQGYFNKALFNLASKRYNALQKMKKILPKMKNKVQSKVYKKYGKGKEKYQNDSKVKNKSINSSIIKKKHKLPSILRRKRDT